MEEIEPAILPEKEQIPKLKFKNKIEIYQSPNLRKKLVEATRLGNNYKGKMRISFLADEGHKAVETTIWATGAKFICLKGGIWLPISRIDQLKML